MSDESQGHEHGDGMCPSCYLHNLGAALAAVARAVDDEDRLLDAIEHIEETTGRDPDELYHDILFLASFGCRVSNDLADFMDGPQGGGSPEPSNN